MYGRGGFGNCSLDWHGLQKFNMFGTSGEEAGDLKIADLMSALAFAANSVSAVVCGVRLFGISGFRRALGLDRCPERLEIGRQGGNGRDSVGSGGLGAIEDDRFPDLHPVPEALGGCFFDEDLDVVCVGSNEKVAIGLEYGISL